MPPVIEPALLIISVMKFLAVNLREVNDPYGAILVGEEN
jgi:hypothetical protein